MILKCPYNYIYGEDPAPWSEGGVGGVCCYTTLVVAIPGHHDVAIFTPSCAPAVEIDNGPSQCEQIVKIFVSMHVRSMGMSCGSMNLDLMLNQYMLDLFHTLPI